MNTRSIPLQSPAALPALLAMLLSVSKLHAGWEEVTSLDTPVTQLSPISGKSPAPKAKSAQSSRNALAAHLRAQITANESFLKESPKDPHAWESRVRLASAQARLASLTADKEGVQKAIVKLKTLEREVPDNSLKAEAMFRRISLEWQDMGDTPDQRRENAVANARSFAIAFPNDRRAPRLLAEAASLCNYHPELKATLIDEAIPLCTEETLLQRLQDDKKQLALLGKPIDLTFTATDGTKVDLSRQRGNVTAVVFWSSESPPSLVWMQYFARFANEIPSLRVVTVSLDSNQADLIAAMNSLKITWPTAFDGKGWQNSIAREFGVNTIPTLWLIDKKGRLAYLNARDTYELKTRELLLKN